jgi:hypothetical protein
MRMVVRVWVVAGLVAFGGGMEVLAQEYTGPTPLPARDEFPPALTFLSPLLIPKLLQDGWRLKEFVCSEEFGVGRKENGDLYAVDLLFDRAMRLSWNNAFEALLITFFAVMDHRDFGLRLPLLGEILWFPLTGEFEDDFQRRVNCLPARLYADSPREGPGDRDKLQHFFGSALLTYVTDSDAAADRVGDFVEWGEERFIVGGVFDERDLRANRQGQRFGLRLLADPGSRPSTHLLEPGRRPAVLASDPDAVPHADTSHVLPEVP